MNDSQQAGADVARALGFDPKEFLEINLRFRAGDLLVVDAQQLVIGDRLKKVADEIVNRKFVCREIKDDGPPVAVPAEQRHDAATCRGRRQEPNVGPKWDILHQGAVLRDGDEWAYISTPDDWSSIPKFSAGNIVRDALTSGKRYRRRVTPSKPVEIDGDKPDVGEGWRDLQPDEILQAGDECDIGVNEPRWVVTQRAGRRVSENTDGDRYRRRVTPEVAPIAAAEPVSARYDTVPPAPQFPKVESLARLNERARLLQKIDTLRSKSDQQQEIILHAGLEVERFSSACEGYTSEIARLTAEVERLRPTPHECRQLYKAVFVLDQLSKNNDIDQEMWSTIRDMSARLGGGE